MRGIVLLALGKPAYGIFAYHMAVSIRAYNNTIPIHLVYEPSAKPNLPAFTSSEQIDPQDLYLDGKFTPALAKLNLYKYLPFEENIYLDVDGVCIRDIQKAFEQGKDYAAESLGFLSLDEDFGQRMLWADGKTISEHYGLDMSFKIPCINSSFQFIRKGDFAEKLYAQALENFKNPIPLGKLKNAWGKSQPDELYMNIACGQLGYDPNTKAEVYFRTRSTADSRTLDDIKKDFSVIGLYGTRDTNHRTVKNYYNGEMARHFRNIGEAFSHKIEVLLTFKFMGR